MEKLNFKNGQSLIELLLAVTVGTVIILVTITVFSLTLRIGQQDASFQVAAFLGQQAADNLDSATERDWQQIAATVEGNNYHLATSTPSGELVVQPGTASIIVDGVVYLSFFRLSPVNRDANGLISPSGVPDPSTKKADIFITWPFRGETATSTVAKYITRKFNRSLLQSNWSGGPTTPSDPMANATTTKFFASDKIDFGSQPGSIRLNAN